MYILVQVFYITQYQF